MIQLLFGAACNLINYLFLQKGNIEQVKVSSETTSNEVISVDDSDESSVLSQDSSCMLSENFKLLNKKSITKMATKAWKKGLTLEDGVSLFLSTCIERLQKLSKELHSTQLQKQAPGTATDPRKRRNPMLSFLNHEKKYLHWTSALISYFVYCKNEDIVEENLKILVQSKTSKQNKKPAHTQFLDKLRAEVTLMQRDPKRKALFTSLRSQLLKSLSSHVKMTQLSNFASDVLNDDKASLSSLGEQLQNKLKNKRSKGIFTFEKYKLHPCHDGMFDEHEEGYILLGLKKFLLKHKELK